MPAIPNVATQTCVIKSADTAADAGIRRAAPILIGAAVMLSLSMGVRQSLGLVMPSLTRDLAISVSEFTLALSVQNLASGRVANTP